MTIRDDDYIPLAPGGQAAPGPCFASRYEGGTTWGGTPAELANLANPTDISKLVVFDTWTLNCDRHPADVDVRKPNYDNVFLSGEGQAERPELVAMDHGHCFTCGSELNRRLATIDRIKDERVYGLFPGFLPYMDRSIVLGACQRLAEFPVGVAEEFVASVPREWSLGEAAAPLVVLIADRAKFVAANLVELLTPICWPQIALPE
jgi:hypothetical protein